MARLGDVCVINPKAPPLEDALLVSFVPMPKVGEEGEFDPSETRPYAEVKKGFTYFAEGDVLFAKITPCMENGKGAVAHNLENGIGYGSTEFHVLRPKSALILGEWLYYLTAWPAFRKEAERNMTGSAGQKRVPKDFLENYRLTVPSIHEQQQHVQALNKLCALISLRKQQIAKLDELVKARFVEMFEGKYESLILGDVLKTTSGGTPSKTHSEYYENGTIPWLSSGEVNAGIISTVKSFITQAGVDNSSAKMIPENSVVIAMYGATAGQVGLLRIATTTNQAVCSVLPDDRYIPEYLYYAIKSKKEWMIGQCAGGAQPNISQGVIKRMKIINAPYDTQSQFAAFVTQTDQQKLTIQHSLAQLEMLKKALMQKYFG